MESVYRLFLVKINLWKSKGEREWRFYFEKKFFRIKKKFLEEFVIIFFWNFYKKILENGKKKNTKGEIKIIKRIKKWNRDSDSRISLKISNLKETMKEEWKELSAWIKLEMGTLCGIDSEFFRTFRRTLKKNYSDILWNFLWKIKFRTLAKKKKKKFRKHDIPRSFLWKLRKSSVKLN